MGIRAKVAAVLRPRVAASDRPVMAAGESRMASRWGWARHWELWLALILGAFLRFWHLDLSTFLVDQSDVLVLARAAVLHHLIPVTSVVNSVGFYVMPFSLYLLLPFALFTTDPFPIIVSVAVWNLLGVLLCYRFALAYFGRWVAGVGTLLFATCGVAVNYSRFIWQPNYEPTFAVLWALALFAWCISGRRGWSAVSAILLLLLIEIHPVAVALIPVMVVAWLLAPRRPGGREYAVFGVVALLTLAPTLLWETITHGLDLQHVLTPASGQPTTFSLTVLRVLYGTIGSHGGSGLGAGSLYDRFGTLFTLTNLVAVLFLLAGYLILSWRVVAPAIRMWRGEAMRGESPSPRMTTRIAAWWRALRTDRRWCVELLLWLWVTLPPLSMVRHAAPPTVHYLLITYPALFLVAAYPLFWLVEADGLRRLTQLAHVPRRTPTVLRGVSFAGVGVAALLIAAQTVQSALYPASLVSPGFQAYQFYGIPLASMQTAESQISALQRRENASNISFSLPVNQRYSASMEYLLVGEHPDRASSSDTCLVLPAPSASPSLVVSTTAESPAAALLPGLPNARHIADIPVLGAAPFNVYAVSGSVPALASDFPVSAAVYHPTPRDALALDAAAIDASGNLRLRWTVLAAQATTDAPEVYTIQAHSVAPGTSTTLGSVTCQPTRWAAGETVYTWLPLGGSANSTLPTALALTLSASAPTLYTPQVGPLHLLSGHDVNTARSLVPPSGASVGAGTSGVAPDGSYYLSLAGLG